MPPNVSLAWRRYLNKRLEMITAQTGDPLFQERLRALRRPVAALAAGTRVDLGVTYVFKC